MPPVVRLQVFGGLRLWRGGAEVAIGGLRQRTVLAALIAARGAAVGGGELVDVVWDGRPPASAVNQLHRLIGQVRRLFEPDLPSRTPGEWVQPVGDGYRLRADERTGDLFAFFGLADEARGALRRGDTGTAAATFAQALAVGGRPLFAGLPPAVLARPAFAALERDRARVLAEAAALLEPRLPPRPAGYLPRADVPSAPPAPLTVVSGLSGAGKTSLALDWAHRVAHRYPDGQLFLDLRDPGPHDPVAAGRRMVVVLADARDSAQVRPLLPGPAGLAIVTSRNRLTGLVTHEGAHPVHLGRLDPGAAAELLRRRAGIEPAAAAELARLCGGLPLALSIAAARLAVTPDAKLTELAGAPSVHAWSYGMLGAPAARLFRVLAVLPGAGFTTRAAAAASGTDVRGPLAELVAAGLIGERGAGRYTMHELLHAYAQELLDAEGDERAGAEKRLRRFSDPERNRPAPAPPPAALHPIGRGGVRATGDRGSARGDPADHPPGG